MNTIAVTRPDDAACRSVDGVMMDVRHMTTAELRRLGVSAVVYLRAGIVDGEMTYVIHAADGTAMAVVEDIDLAVDMVSAEGMAFVAVH